MRVNAAWWSHWRSHPDLHSAFRQLVVPCRQSTQSVEC